MNLLDRTFEMNSKIINLFDHFAAQPMLNIIRCTHKSLNTNF